jgi:hypothetical protein
LAGDSRTVQGGALHPPLKHTTVDANNTVILALTNQIAQLKKQHRQEVQALRTALEQAHGENLTLRRELTRRGWTGPPPAAARTADR